MKSVKRDARKQLLIAEPPSILTLHLKRFEQFGTLGVGPGLPASLPFLPLAHRKAHRAGFSTLSSQASAYPRSRSMSIFL